MALMASRRWSRPQTSGGGCGCASCRLRDARRGPAGGGENLTPGLIFASDRAPYHAMVADVRPCLLDQRRPTERNERRGTVKERRSELFALRQEVVRRVQLWRHCSRAVTKWRHSSLQAAQLQAAVTPFIMEAFEAAHPRSRTMLVIYLCMLHVLTDVCSRRAHRLCSFFTTSSSQRDRRLLDAALHRPRAAAAASDDACSAQALEMAFARLHPHAAAVLDGGDGGPLPAVRCP